jgi:tetratricopeptide (TPR) repeat protein
MRLLYYILFTIITCLLTACGSPPKPETPFDTGKRLSSQANLAYRGGKLQDALSLYYEALQEYTKIDDGAGIARVSNNIAITLYQMGKFSEAEGFITSAMKKYDELSDDLNKARCLLNLGSISIMQDKWEDAGTAFELASKFFTKEKYPLENARASLGLSMVKCREGKLENAEVLVKSARIIFEKYNDKPGIASTDIVSARISRLKGDYETAKGFALKALKSDKEQGVSIEILCDLQELGNIFENIDKKTAYEYFSRALGVAQMLKLENTIKTLEEKLKSLRGSPK